MFILQEYWAAYRKANDSLITNLFCGQLQSVITCNICTNTSAKYSASMGASLPVLQNVINVPVIVMPQPSGKDSWTMVCYLSLDNTRGLIIDCDFLFFQLTVVCRKEALVSHAEIYAVVCEKMGAIDMKVILLFSCCWKWFVNVMCICLLRFLSATTIFIWKRWSNAADKDGNTERIHWSTSTYCCPI